MTDQSRPIQVFMRPSNTNAGGGYWIDADGYHFECRWWEAAAVLGVLNAKGLAAAWRAYRKVIRDRVNGVNYSAVA